MSKPSPNRAGGDLALPPDMAERLGPTRYRLIKQWVADVNGAFDRLLATHVTADSVLLDAGCSRGDPDIPSMLVARRVIGCDVDAAGLRANTLADDRVQGVLDHLPLRDDSIDAIVCKFVMEHLADPSAVCREFARVLRPGGAVVVLTPNRLSPFAVLSRAVPLRLKQWLKGRLFGGYEEDTFPTLYRANSPACLNAVMVRAGFGRTDPRLIGGTWAFLCFSRTLALGARSVEAVFARTPALKGLSTYILGMWRLPAV